jgi:hypothetical protein
VFEFCDLDLKKYMDQHNSIISKNTMKVRDLRSVPAPACLAPPDVKRGLIKRATL